MSGVGALETERFLVGEAALLDRGAFEAWLALFTADGWYWVPAAASQPDPYDHVSLFFENKPLMRMRIERLTHPRAHSLAHPIRTSRVLGNVVLHGGDGGDVLVRSRFHLTECRNGAQRVFAGAYTHRLAVTPEGLRIRVKRVDLVNVDACHEPMQVFL
jgi:benzoate/toluate 1,2-dioxygenase beta subunit